MKRLLPALAVTAALVLTGCTDEGTDDLAIAQTEDQECPSAPGPDPVPAPPGSSDDLQTKPEVVLPDGDAPSELEVFDVVEGGGDLACPGDTLEMQYVGVLYDGGSQFDASWDRGQPFEFVLGGGQVIQGWDQGIVGMRQGGRRGLVIPAELGYGERGAGTDIPPGATLVFVVDVVGVTKG